MDARNDLRDRHTDIQAQGQTGKQEILLLHIEWHWNNSECTHKHIIHVFLNYLQCYY